MSRITSPLCALALALAAAGCGGGSSNYHIPTGENVKPFQAPEAEALLADEDDAWDLAAEELDEEEADDGAEDTEPAPAPATAPAMPAEDGAAEPATTPAQPAQPAKTPAK